MTLATALIVTPKKPSHGQVRFLSPSERLRLICQPERSQWLIATLPPLGPTARYRLRTYIEEAIEHQLSLRCCPVPCVGSSPTFAEVLKDQVQRAVRNGVRGIVVAVESLSSLLGESGALNDEDSAAVRTVASLCGTFPCELWLSPADEFLPICAPPVPLHTLLCSQFGAEVPVGRAAASFSLKSKGLGSLFNSHFSRESEDISQRCKPSEKLSWKMLAQTLNDSRGPKNLATIEKLYVHTYVPLAKLAREQQLPDLAVESLRQFQQDFEKNYLDIFAAAKVTKRRPNMVLDVPHIARRLAHLHGARSTALVLVDAMRFDVGVELEVILRDLLAGYAVLVDHMVLWEALPPVTTTQLMLLQRGAQALDDPLDTLELREQEMPIMRGRTAAMIRRVRAGNVHLYKLDVVQADLSASGLPESRRIHAQAEAVASALRRLVATFHTGTLMFVFGDHGFVLPSTPTATGAALSATAKPEEIIVPAQAWMIGSGDACM